MSKNPRLHVKTRSSRQNTTSRSGNIRIISGKWRGRKLPVHDLEGLRPTTDRVKETVFNWLMNDVAQRNVLDCFAGSGGLGFETLSRGAFYTVFVEKSTKASEQLKKNCATLNVENAKVLNLDTLQWLRQSTPQQPFSLVFIDPPFRQGFAQKTIDLLEDNDWLSEDALIYVEVESEQNELIIPTHWTLLKEKTAGQVSYQLYERNAPQ